MCIFKIRGFKRSRAGKRDGGGGGGERDRERETDRQRERERERSWLTVDLVNAFLPPNGRFRICYAKFIFVITVSVNIEGAQY